MSFGYSVTDFVACGQLAWKIYKACKDTLDNFKNISHEVLPLHAVLKEVEEANSDANLSAARQSRQRTVGDGCRDVLEDLQAILDNAIVWAQKLRVPGIDLDGAQRMLRS